MLLSSREKTILLVEDSNLTRFSSSRVLEDRGYIVEEASSGKEALVKARQRKEPYDLVIIDIYLPGLDGLDLLEKLKATPDYRYVPVMMFSSETRMPVVKRAIELGAVEYLCKPFTAEQLVQRVKKLIGPGVGKGDTPVALLHRVLKNEINRAGRGNLKLALVLARREGLEKGKIEEHGRRVQHRLRDIDTVIVLSSSTLAAALPLTGVEGAQVVVKKMSTWLSGEWSFGVAVYPDNGKDGEELFIYAENSLKLIN